MELITTSIDLSTQGHTDIVDITPQVQQALNDCGMEEGFVQLFALGSTTGISTIEYEPGLVQTDMKVMLEKLAPYNVPYQHNKTWGDNNGASHLRSTLIGTSYAVPFQEGELILGTWQQIIFLDFDTHPRQRKVVLQFFGKKKSDINR